MAEQLFELVRGYFGSHGYWTIFVVLLLENAGVPVPGETVLLFASFLAAEEGNLLLGQIILVAAIACVVGDNIGYFIGSRGGRPLLDRYRSFFRIPESVITRGEHLFEHYGAVTIFLSRFIFGLRIVAGPLAGALRMPWRKFAFYNVLGAVTWVVTISLAGYFFGEHWAMLVKMMGRFNLVIALVVIYAAYHIWSAQRRRRRKPEMS